jgi:3,4-dihydroxy 2-butanone 4-phosphate synthase
LRLDDAVKDFLDGKFLLVHDSGSRENEVDMVMATEAVEADDVTTMRRDAGGLICVAVHPKIAENIGLPYLTKVYETASKKFRILKLAQSNDIPYDEHSAFSLSVNHRRTFTGITDSDRALTISELGKIGVKAMQKSVMEEFGKKFRSPGHVPLLRASDGLLDSRRGHTELTVALAELAGGTPVTVVCEMLDAQTKKALSKEKAAKYAKAKKIAFVDGSEIVKAWEGRK